MKQTNLASLAYDAKKKQTCREKLLSEMEKAVLWRLLLQVIERYYLRNHKASGYLRVLRFHIKIRRKILNPLIQEFP